MSTLDTLALRKSQLTICNERDVGDNRELVEELSYIDSVNGFHIDDINRFVAIVVNSTPELGHESAMHKYGMEGNRDGKIYVHNWKRVPIAIWDLVIENKKFLVIGPCSFKKNHSNNLVERLIVNRIEFLKSNNAWTPRLFKTYPPERLPMNSVVPLSMEDHLENLIQQSLKDDKLDEERREQNKRLRELQRLHDLQNARERKNIQIEDNIMNFDDLKIKTIHEAYHTLPSTFKRIMPWVKTEKCLRGGGYVAFEEAIREWINDHSITATEKINIEYVASVSECTCKPDLIQLTSKHVLESTRVAPYK